MQFEEVVKPGEIAYESVGQRFESSRAHHKNQRLTVKSP